jgi:hypothetical protein
MIIKEFYKVRKDGVSLFRVSSTKGLKIRKLDKDWMGNTVATDEVYDTAIDVQDAPYEYEETDFPIESEVQDLAVQ